MKNEIKCPNCGNSLPINTTNARNDQLRKCIVTDIKRFSRIMNELMGEDIIVSCGASGIKIYSKSRTISMIDIYGKLAEHYNVSRVYDLHIDDTDTIYVWICYE